MSQSTIHVDCPCCGAKIEVRRDDGRVLRHWAKPAAKTNEDPLKAAAARLKAEKAKRERYMANAQKMLEDEKRRREEKFEQEKKRVLEEGDTSRPPNPFDYD